MYVRQSLLRVVAGTFNKGFGPMFENLVLEQGIGTRFWSRVLEQA